MVKKIKLSIIWGGIALCFLSFKVMDWGFYAHRKINYYAALTVPPPVNQFYKARINFLRDHAVDPDRRRYAVPGEGPRHFIDLDRWFSGDSCVLREDYTTDRILQGNWTWKSDDTTMTLQVGFTGKGRAGFISPGFSLHIDSFALNHEVYQTNQDAVTLISPFLYPDQEGQLFFSDSLSLHGIVPYYVEKLYTRLVREMTEKSLENVLKISADIGHYISDAHVPLHTTSNYNGQLTDQLGIHAFWESRIPELFQETEFNSLAGRAKYIPNIHNFIWKTVLHSYRLVPEVLAKELEARKKVAEQDHYCYEERGSTMVRTPCPVLAREYMRLMDGMVQRQWINAIRAVGSIWYSAWIDAGRPDLWREKMVELQDSSLLDKMGEKPGNPSERGRSHLH